MINQIPCGRCFFYSVRGRRLGMALITKINNFLQRMTFGSMQIWNNFRSLLPLLDKTNGLIKGLHLKTCNKLHLMLSNPLTYLWNHRASWIFRFLPRFCTWSFRGFGTEAKNFISRYLQISNNNFICCSQKHNLMLKSWCKQRKY